MMSAKVHIVKSATLVLLCCALFRTDEKLGSLWLIGASGWTFILAREFYYYIKHQRNAGR